MSSGWYVPGQTVRISSFWASGQPSRAAAALGAHAGNDLDRHVGRVLPQPLDHVRPRAEEHRVAFGEERHIPSRANLGGECLRDAPVADRAVVRPPPHLEGHPRTRCPGRSKGATTSKANPTSSRGPGCNTTSHRSRTRAARSVRRSGSPGPTPTTKALGSKIVFFCMNLRFKEWNLVTQQCCTAGRDIHSAIDQT